MESLILFIVFIGLITIIYFKIDTNLAIKLPIITIIFLFSLIIGTSTFFNEVLIGTPYIQIFFILYQLIFFIMSCLDYFEIKKVRN